ncbi:hypothetical protein J3R83DRAFT_11547 [Lanmaoa asiatica]|nr:hypothetical protein J3R83DRAFT_11547 [Lanmaoa asiatica]
MAKRQKLTAVHDISDAWNGIGAAIGASWQQTKVASAPSTILLTVAYLSCISGLHIISSSVIQFEVFNNTVTSSCSCQHFDWATISPLMVFGPLLPTARGLSGSTLYDVPSPDYSYTGAIVNVTTISAGCGLLSNLSAGTWNSTTGIYDVDISGLGEVGLPVTGLSVTSRKVSISSLLLPSCSLMHLRTMEKTTANNIVPKLTVSNPDSIAQITTNYNMEDSIGTHAAKAPSSSQLP